MRASRSLLLCDGPATSEDGDALVVRWGGGPVADGEISLPREVERDWRRLRDDYLAWVHALGETAIGGRTIRQHLVLDGAPSFWWMTLMAEKSPMKTRAIYTVFRLRALERLCEAREVRRIAYAGSDRAVDAVLGDWCRRTGRTYARAAAGDPPRHKSATVLGRRVRWLPHPLRGLAWLCWTWWTRARPVRARRVRSLDAPAPPTAIVTYFPNCDDGALREGRFVSSYWQDLHALLDDLPGGVDWTWLYVPSSQATLADALDHRDRCNAAGGGQRFRLLEEFVSPRVWLRAVGLFLRLARRAPRLLAAHDLPPMAGSCLDLRPVAFEDWKASLAGVVAAEAAWYVAAFDAMARSRPAPVRALYVCENQPWEAALVAAWKRAGAPAVIAHQHEAIKPLNLRLFDDSRGFGDTGSDARPRPDLLAVGSAHALETFRDAGQPADTMRLVESLRFRNASPAARMTAGGCLLLVTGYLAGETRTMLALAAQADSAGALDGYAGIVVKPHPYLPVDDMLAALDFGRPVEISGDGLGSLWPRTRFAFIANSTAAILDSLAAGVPSAVCAPDDDLNLSPALGMEGVPAIADAAALATALRDPSPPAAAAIRVCADPGLPRWAALLGLSAGAAETGAPPLREAAGRA